MLHSAIKQFTKVVINGETLNSLIPIAGRYCPQSSYHRIIIFETIKRCFLPEHILGLFQSNKECKIDGAILYFCQGCGVGVRSTEHGVREYSFFAGVLTESGVLAFLVLRTPKVLPTCKLAMYRKSFWLNAFFSRPIVLLKLLPKLLCFKLTTNSYSFQPG